MKYYFSQFSYFLKKQKSKDLSILNKRKKKSKNIVNPRLNKSKQEQLVTDLEV